MSIPKRLASLSRLTEGYRFVSEYVFVKECGYFICPHPPFIFCGTLAAKLRKYTFSAVSPISMNQ